MSVDEWSAASVKRAQTHVHYCKVTKKSSYKVKLLLKTNVL